MMLAIIGALLIGISLGLLGSGGSILTVPVLIYLLGQDEKVAIAGSLAVVGCIALAGAIPHIFKRNVNWHAVVWFGVPGIIGTWLGAWSSSFISGITQLTLFAIIMLVAAYKMYGHSPIAKIQLKPRNRYFIIADGLVVGIITGIVGVGGGFLIVPALVLLTAMSMRQAIATSLVIIALKSGSGFIKYIEVLDSQGLNLDWQTLIIISAFGIVGTFFGGKLSARLAQDKLRQYFSFFLVAMAVYILFKNIPLFI
jgi:uncharacterized protein